MRLDCHGLDERCVVWQLRWGSFTLIGFIARALARLTPAEGVSPVSAVKTWRPRQKSQHMVRCFFSAGGVSLPISRASILAVCFVVRCDSMVISTPRPGSRLGAPRVDHHHPKPHLLISEAVPGTGGARITYAYRSVIGSHDSNEAEYRRAKVRTVTHCELGKVLMHGQ
jgi:hypothetical protein